MKIAFRADASLQIGTGHIMRCLTLADELTQLGAECYFLTRKAEGDLIAWIQQKNYPVIILSQQHTSPAPPYQLQHEHWLTSTWQADADECRNILQTKDIDLIIVDHYALDHRWENRLDTPIVVIDDLADRTHHCQLLLDQTYGRIKTDYQSLVPSNCRLLVGCQFALLRPEFSLWRNTSLKHRQVPTLKKILLSLGGVDANNMTGQVLDALSHCSLPSNCCVHVILGASSIHLSQIQQQIPRLPFTTQVEMGVQNMAECMAHSDLAIGAAGSSAWERCALGLPTFMIVLATNQKIIAKHLSTAGIAKTLDNPAIQKTLIEFFSAPDLLDKLSRMSHAAMQIVDGQGAKKVALEIQKSQHLHTSSI